MTAAVPATVGFFTDTSVCIGCKACEVACKEWNHVPDDGMSLTGMSYDNTGGLGASTWRHVAFIEQAMAGGAMADGAGALASPGAIAGGASALASPGAEAMSFRWLMESDVCKHCAEAGCLDVCPTGALFRTEFGTVVVQNDICNGCGYCVPACPFGVIERRDEPAGDAAVGLAQKCTLCYDRLRADQVPACAKACPTESIQFGELADLRARARERVEALQGAGVAEARLYGTDPATSGVGGTHAMFLLLDEPEVYGLPPDPVVPTRGLGRLWRHAGAAAASLALAAAAAFLTAGSEGRR